MINAKIIPPCRGCIYLTPLTGGLLGNSMGCGYSLYTGELKGKRQDPCPFKDTDPSHKQDKNVEFLGIYG